MPASQFPFTGFEPFMTPSSVSRIPSLDGLRAISCALVVLGHGVVSLPASVVLEGPAAEVLYNARLGVAVFFAISGFLITRILMNEQNRTGTISLKQFYIRRAFRIFPPFYVYLAVVGVLTLAGVFHIPGKMFVAAGTYMWNYLHWTAGWELGHFWSLAIEEQFYMFWPLLLLLTGQKRAKTLALAIIICSPFVRVGSYYLLPSSRPFISIMLHTRLDALMYGCLLALSLNDPWLVKWRQFAFRTPVLIALGVVVAVVSPNLTAMYGGQYLLTVGYTIEGICIATILLYSVEHSSSLFGRFLNLPWMVWLGTLSYSLYLWQQILVMRENPASQFPPLQFVSALVAAMLSYHLVEQPALRLRDRWFPPTSQAKPRVLAKAVAASSASA